MAAMDNHEAGGLGMLLSTFVARWNHFDLSPVQFHYVFIRQEVIAVDHLALKSPVPPDARILELAEKIMVDMRRQVEQA
jgi:hypothetical protein